MKSINRCRIYLQVTFVSDITGYEGKEIIKEALEVKQFGKSVLNWSRHVRPIIGDRRILQEYLNKLCFDTNKLTITLGS